MISSAFISFLFSLLNSLLFQNQQVIEELGIKRLTVEPDDVKSTSTKATTRMKIPTVYTWRTPPGTVLTKCAAVSSMMRVIVEDQKSGISLTTFFSTTPKDIIAVNGTCEEEQQDITIRWIPAVGYPYWSLTFYFVRHKERYTLEQVKLKYRKDSSDDENEADTDTALFSLPVGAYYKHSDLLTMQNLKALCQLDRVEEEATTFP
ncbi:unnamed protein product [Heterobilharzia americana]|nr:unnamed protein product [Heterobilharzia americana]